MYLLSDVICKMVIYFCLYTRITMLFYIIFLEAVSAFLTIGQEPTFVYNTPFLYVALPCPIPTSASTTFNNIYVSTPRLTNTIKSSSTYISTPILTKTNAHMRLSSNIFTFSDDIKTTIMTTNRSLTTSNPSLLKSTTHVAAATGAVIGVVILSVILLLWYKKNQRVNEGMGKLLYSTLDATIYTSHNRKRTIIRSTDERSFDAKLLKLKHNNLQKILCIDPFLQGMLPLGFWLNETNIKHHSFWDIISGVFHGLHYLESQQLCHGDIHPRNIFILTNSSPLICNFHSTVRPQAYNLRFEPIDRKWCTPYHFNAEPITFTSELWCFGLFIMWCVSQTLPVMTDNQFKEYRVPDIDDFNDDIRLILNECFKSHAKFSTLLRLMTPVDMTFVNPEYVTIIQDSSVEDEPVYEFAEQSTAIYQLADADV